MAEPYATLLQARRRAVATTQTKTRRRRRGDEKTKTRRRRRGDVPMTSSEEPLERGLSGFAGETNNSSTAVIDADQRAMNKKLTWPLDALRSVPESSLAHGRSKSQSYSNLEDSEEASLGGPVAVPKPDGNPEDQFVGHTRSDSTCDSIRTFVRPQITEAEGKRSYVEMLIGLEVRRWRVKDKQQALRTCMEALALVLRADGGLLLFVCPESQINNPEHVQVQSTDDNYMTNRLRRRSDGRTMTIFDSPCQKGILDFSNHALESGDRWPEDYPDEAARGKPKDGAIAVTSKGHIAKAAAKILNVCAPHEWADRGTKHEAAAFLASKLQESVVIIRSSHGRTCCLFGGRTGVVYEIR